MEQSKYRRWLFWLAKANQKEFGYERLECCHVNKPVKNKNRLPRNNK